MIKLLHIDLAAVMVLVLALSMPTRGQSIEAPELRLGSIIGTVTDINGDAVPHATVLLKGNDTNDRIAVVTSENGFFEFHDAKPGIPYQIGISAKDFADWTSPTITLEPGQFKILADIRLRIETQSTTVQVTHDSVEVATEQFKVLEHQRILGIVPNFYVSYESNAEPLTTKRKFALALKVATDPVTAVGIAFYSGVQQAGNVPNYQQGAIGYGERFGANAADGFTDIMIGGAILPSLLHQDPRYFYQGTGTTGSRIRHAMFSPFVAKGDNGKCQPNYSSLGGDLASSALSNLYYPESNRGVGLVFGNFAIGTAQRIAASLAQEFILSKLTRRGGHVK
jgi:hypothetical protein